MNLSNSSLKDRSSLLPLSVGALGVVFGDIGTSPLYALRESLSDEGQIAVAEGNVYGVLSLMFWSLIIVVTVKYLLLVMRADNDGEGGILALVALVGGDRGSRLFVLAGLFGTALLYGDGMITPAISVLSAVEGIEVALPSVHRWVLPIAAVILIGLFSVQHRGTAAMGRFFGPIMILWFLVLGLLGALEIGREPAILQALNPVYAIRFFVDNGVQGFLTLGTVFLVVTGGEALYADMGHFGRLPIQIAWFSLALPALVLNYLGQGALLLSDQTTIESPFFLLAPSWGQLPLTVLATAATIIASQALITGAFSLTVQAINLNFLPRIRVVQTSADQKGQVYIPAINWFLLVACLILVFSFGSSARLAAAYGVAVTITMVVTTGLIAAVAVNHWGWSKAKTAVVVTPLLLVDLAFAAANLFKIPSGGWFPLVIGVAGFVVFTTWSAGRQLVAQRVERAGLSVSVFLEDLSEDSFSRHIGTGVYLHRTAGLVPPALLANLRHNASLHETVVLLSVVTDDRPHVLPAARDRSVRHPLGFFELEMRYGFLDQPDLGSDLRDLLIDGLTFDPDHTTYFLGRERIGVIDDPGMSSWREHLYALLSRNAADPSAHFGLPIERSVDIGTHLNL